MILFMSDKGKREKNKITPDVEVNDGRFSDIVDAVSDSSVSVAKTIAEVARAPLRTAGRVIDGAIQGAKQGYEQRNNPIDMPVKVVTGTTIGTGKGVVEGVKNSAKKVGEAIQETGKNIMKVGSSVAGKKKDSDDYEIVEEKK